jgi:hypothetical protein
VSYTGRHRRTVTTYSQAFRAWPWLAADYERLHRGLR